MYLCCGIPLHKALWMQLVVKILELCEGHYSHVWPIGSPIGVLKSACFTKIVPLMVPRRQEFTPHRYLTLING